MIFSPSWLVFSLQASENDGLPPIVCVKCREQLDSCHRFRRAAHRTQQALLDYLQFTSKLNGTPQVSFKFFFTLMTFFFLLRVCISYDQRQRWCFCSLEKCVHNFIPLFIRNAFMKVTANTKHWEVINEISSDFCVHTILRIYYAIELWQVRTYFHLVEISLHTLEYVVWHLNMPKGSKWMLAMAMLH